MTGLDLGVCGESGLQGLDLVSVVERGLQD